MRRSVALLHGLPRVAAQLLGYCSFYRYAVNGQHRYDPEVDTPENREQAIYDIAKLTERMIMRNRTHGGYRVLLDDLRKFVEEFNADMVILWEHMSCKALNGMHGQFEEKAREKGIHLVWVTHDLFDPRVISRQGVRDQINRYMRAVMQEEPLDPSLEIIHDEHSW